MEFRLNAPSESFLAEVERRSDASFNAMLAAAPPGMFGSLTAKQRETLRYFFLAGYVAGLRDSDEAAQELRKRISEFN